MTIKRYIPKYKILAKLKFALWFEKRKKINQLTRQKWEGKKKFYFPRKAKHFNQDSSTYPVGFDFDGDRSIRLKKVYKHLLLAKQAFQLYYGARRLRYFQLRRMSLHGKKIGKRKKISPARVFFHLMENRLEHSLYRLGFVSALIHSRKLLATNRVKVNADFIKNFGYRLGQDDIIKLEEFKSLEILSRYLKFNVPFFYFRYSEKRRRGLLARKQHIAKSFLERHKFALLCYAKDYLIEYQSRREKK